MTTEDNNDKPGHHRKIHITIDGQAFTIEDRHFTAAELLALAGLPASWLRPHPGRQARPRRDLPRRAEGQRQGRRRLCQRQPAGHGRVTAQMMAATGVDAFVAALDAAGAEPLVTSGLVTYTVTPVTGALADRAVRTGVIVRKSRRGRRRRRTGSTCRSRCASPRPTSGRRPCPGGRPTLATSGRGGPPSCRSPPGSPTCAASWEVLYEPVLCGDDDRPGYGGPPSPASGGRTGGRMPRHLRALDRGDPHFGDPERARLARDRGTQRSRQCLIRRAVRCPGCQRGRSRGSASP